MWNTLGFLNPTVVIDSTGYAKPRTKPNRTLRSMLDFGLITVLMKSDVANFCQHFVFSQDSSKPLRREPQNKGQRVDERALPFDTRVSTGSIRPHVQIERRASGQICCERWAVNIKIIRSSTIFPNKESRLVSWDLLFTLITWSERATFYHVPFICARKGNKVAPTHDRLISSALPVGISFRFLCKENEGSWERLVVSYL